MNVKFTQIISASWKGDNGLTYSLFGLTAKGQVYRYKPCEQVWIPLGMEIGEATEPFREFESAFEETP